MQTFLDIQNDALRRIGDEDDADKMRDLVKVSINSVQRQVLTERRYQFMLWPKVETLSIVADQKNYSLHPQFGQLWYGQNETTGDFLEELPAGEIIASGDNLITGEIDNPYRCLLTSVQNVKAQPSFPGLLEVGTSGGSESSSSKIFVKGIDNNGDYVEETLSSATSWTLLTSATTWVIVESISKIGTFTRTISCAIGGTVILALYASEYGRQYRQLELTKIPTTSGDIFYRFYRKPLKLVNDFDMPQIPEEYTDILVYGALLDLQGYSRPTEGELDMWIRYKKELIDQMQKQYSQSRSVGARSSYINHIAR